VNLSALIGVFGTHCDLEIVGAIGFTSWFIVQRYFIDILRWSRFIDVLGVELD
jgi:hypothetical protein